MLFIYVIFIAGGLLGASLVVVHKINSKNDAEIKKIVSKMFSDLPKETRYEMLMQTYNALKTHLLFLEQKVDNVRQFAEIDKIKRNMKIILNECQKLEKK